MTVANPRYSERIWDADDNRWIEAKRIIGTASVTLGPQASDQWLHAPDHLAMVLARYRVAAALIGGAQTVREIGCGEGIGAGILARNRNYYSGIDTDRAAIAQAQAILAQRDLDDRQRMSFSVASALDLRDPLNVLGFDAVVSLDVIEHIAPDCEASFMENATRELYDYGVLVVGTPSKNAEHLASPQSRAGHVNLYTPTRLRDLMDRYFQVVQTFGMQDTALHLGHPEMAHYLVGVGIGPKREA